MTGLVRGLAGGLAGVIVALAAHFGLALDQDTVVIVLTAVVGALVTGAVHWAEGRWPAVRRLVAWLGREALPAVRLTASGTAPPGTTVQVSVPTGPAGPSNVRRVPPEPPSTP